jgi:hypothetical protein
MLWAGAIPARTPSRRPPEMASDVADAMGWTRERPDRREDLWTRVLPVDSDVRKQQTCDRRSLWLRSFTRWATRPLATEVAT